MHSYGFPGPGPEPEPEHFDLETATEVFWEFDICGNWIRMEDSEQVEATLRAGQREYRTAKENKPPGGPRRIDFAAMMQHNETTKRTRRVRRIQRRAPTEVRHSNFALAHSNAGRRVGIEPDAFWVVVQGLN